jgi:adenine-specific DNA-methyltransferase
MTKLAKEALLKPEQLAKLKELFPQAFVDGKVDFVLLKALLGAQVEESNEKYQFTWNGKQNAIAHAQKPSSGTLREDKASSKNFDSTDNLYIEGDNLEVLKLLQKTYQGKIKMIYIDPPYNTGNDFVYKDDFKDNVKNYLELTNQKNKSNAETSGRYHTDWLNMMYPRLMLARNLLTDDGVIFISIDDNEQANLKKICDEIFGESNYISQMPRKTVSHMRILADYELQKLNDYVFVYSKNKNFIKFNKEITGEIEYEYVDELGKYTLKAFQNSGANGTRKARPNLYYPIYYNENKKDFSLVNRLGDIQILPKKVRNEDGRWLWSKEKFNIDKNQLIFINGTIKKKFYYNENDDQSKYQAMKTWLDSFENRLGASTLKSLDLISYFDYSKPVDLIIFLSQLIVNDSDLILDFFSGSGTTAHAVMKLNAEDGGNRRFIMVQLPEKTDEDSEAFKAGYKNICEIGKERIRRAGEKVKQEMLEKDSSSDVTKLDVGFKVFKLDSTNIKPWDGTQDINQMLLEASGNVVKKDRTDLDVVNELMLMYGVFNEEVVEIKINGKTLYSIGEHFLMVCLFKSITKQDIEAIIKLKPKNVIFNDAGFENDNVKINAELTLKNHGVEDIKSL